MKRVLIVTALLLTATTAKTTFPGFVSITQPSSPWFRSRTSGSIVISSAPAIPSFVKHSGDPLFTRLYATNNKKRKQGNSRSNSSSNSGSGFGSKTTSRSSAVAAATSVATPLSAPTQQPRIRALNQLSSEPLIFTIDDFVSPETCQALMQQPDDSTNTNTNNQSSSFEEARLNFASLVASELFQGQWGKHDGLRFNKSSSSDANNDDSRGVISFPEGLHVDTNNGSVHRSVTLILYLNDVPVECGGHTVFPLAGAEDGDALLEASVRLLKGGIGHTRGRAAMAGEGSSGSSSTNNNNKGDDDDGVLLPSQEADALLMEHQTSSQSGLWVAPQAGRLCIFFSRTGDGEIDARSWHGGERLVGDDDISGVTEKRILTLFKEVSYGAASKHTEDYDVTTSTSLEEYLAPQIAEQREALQVLARSHAGFFI